MPSLRDQIQMTEGEIAEFLATEHTLICATIGPRGWPHVMPLRYVMRDREPWAWTFAKSQKVKNLERDPRATVLVEAGKTYEELRGVMIETDVELMHDPQVVRRLGIDLITKYTPGGRVDPEAIARVEKQAPKRVAMRFVPQRCASWDHRKLGGGY